MIHIKIVCLKKHKKGFTKNPEGFWASIRDDFGKGVNQTTLSSVVASIGLIIHRVMYSHLAEAYSFLFLYLFTQHPKGLSHCLLDFIENAINK